MFVHSKECVVIAQSKINGVELLKNLALIEIQFKIITSLKIRVMKIIAIVIYFIFIFLMSLKFVIHHVKLVLAHLTKNVLPVMKLSILY